MSYNELHGLTIPSLLRRRAAEMPSAPAFSGHSWKGHRDRLSYGQLVHRMEMMGRALYSHGISHGDRVAIFLTNYASRECVLTALGCLEIGAVVVPLNTRSSDDELQHALTLTEPVTIVCMAESAARLAQLYPAAGLLQLDAPPECPQQWPDPEHTFVKEAAPTSVRHTDLACLLFTSGTTARSKAVMHSHSSMLHTGQAMGSAVGLESGDRYQGAWPFFTSSVMSMACMSSWVHRACVVLEQIPMSNAERLRLIETEGTTVYHGVTSIIHFLIDEYVQGTYDLSRVRRFGYGGAVMPPEVIDKIATRVPWADQIHVWGMTETGPAGTYLPAHFLPRKAGAIGIAMPTCSVRVIDADGKPVPQGESGEIVFSGPSMAMGYFRNQDATQEAFVDGWVHTGDIGRFDDEGILHFVDRIKDIINRGGLKISSAAVESAIYSFPGIAEAAVIAVPHEGLGEDVAACVVPVPGTTLSIEALAEHCAARLADYARPRHWHVLDALPKNPMGKVLKRDLRDSLAASTTPAKVPA